MTKLVIIGAAGYVGSELVQRLTNKGFDVTAITNANGKILLKKYNIPIFLQDNYSSLGKFDTVINLAYPKRITPSQDKNENKKIVTMINHFTHRESRIIHISTQAVFGYGLEHTILANQVKNRYDFAYVSSKIFIENLLIDRFKKNKIDILRLGNVWGPASPIWTANLINRLSFGDVIGISGEDGYSNTTDVKNVASYIEHLISEEQNGHLIFHHLAEFGEINWSYWINLISKKIGINPIYIKYTPERPMTITKEVFDSLSEISPIKLAKKLSRKQFSGSFIRSILAKLPTDFVANLERKSIKKDFSPDYNEMGIADSFLKMMSCKKRFEMVVSEKWKPEVDINKSWLAIEDWIDKSGF